MGRRHFTECCRSLLASRASLMAKTEAVAQNPATAASVVQSPGTISRPAHARQQEPKPAGQTFFTQSAGATMKDRAQRTLSSISVWICTKIVRMRKLGVKGLQSGPRSFMIASDRVPNPNNLPTHPASRQPRGLARWGDRVEVETGMNLISCLQRVVATLSPLRATTPPQWSSTVGVWKKCVGRARW